MPTVYALLIAINEYPIAHHRLGGCVNDMLLMKQYLENQFPTQERLTLKLLQDSQATRQAVIEGFDHFNQAVNGDVCLLYYSGHGSQAKAPKEFWTESDGMNESLVLYDSRLAGGRDLMDKELGYLIWKANEGKDISFVVIMDCCHAGSGTRGDFDVLVRMAEPSFSPGILEDYLGYEFYQKTYYSDGWTEVAPPRGRHVVLAAAKSYQTAKEKPIDGDRHGVFTYSLIKALQELGEQASYAGLIQQTAIQTAQLVSDQVPQFESTEANDSRRLFLDNSATVTDSWVVSYDKGQWWLNAGKVHDIRQGGTLRLAETNTDITVGEISVSRTLIVSGMDGLDQTKLYRVHYQPPADRRIRLAIAPGGDTRITALLDEGNHLFTLTNDAANAQFLIHADPKQLYLTLPTALDSPLFLPVAGDDVYAVQDFSEKVDTVIRWHNLLLINNPRTRLDTEAVTVEFQRVLNYDHPDDAAPYEAISNPTEPVACYYQYENGIWQQPCFRLKVTNNSQERLYVSALYLSQNYEITNVYLPKAELAPGESTWMVYESLRTLPLYVWPDKEQFIQLGINEITEYIKILISTEEFSTDHYNQEGIALFRLKGIGFRGIGSTRPKLPDWAVRTITLTIICPAETGTVSSTNSTQLHRIVVKPHPALKASISLTSVVDATRSLAGGVGVDSAFRRFFDDETAQTFSFAQNSLTGTRSMGTAPSLNVVELVAVEGAETVTPDTPLQLDVSAYLGVGETLLPFGYDEQTGLFFPLGFERAGVIEVEQLPDPTAQDIKSLGGSIKLFFKKLVAGTKQTGVLSLVTVDEQEIVTRIQDDAEGGLEVIRSATANANRVLLFIHGIIGDTEEMVKAVRRVKFADSGQPILTRYDAILAFDYENLDTRIQETAQVLQDKLRAVGLKPDDDKVVHIMAHSMGGLVSRWFIEKLQGSQSINHLMMLGTPNNGSPWSDVEAMTLPLITKAVNGIALLKPYLIPLAFLGKQANRMFTTLGQMQRDSEFLKSLNDGTQSSVPYTIIAGNTKLVPVLYDNDMTLWRKIWERFRTRAVYTILDTVLFREGNDIAVLVSSIQEVSGPRVVKQVPIACNHISYFCDEDSLKVIGESMLNL